MTSVEVFCTGKMRYAEANREHPGASCLHGDGSVKEPGAANSYERTEGTEKGIYFAEAGTDVCESATL